MPRRPERRRPAGHSGGAQCVRAGQQHVQRAPPTLRVAHDGAAQRARALAAQQPHANRALRDGQIATQGDADNMALVGGSGAYAGARGAATGEDHSDRVDVTLHLLA